MLPRNRRRPAAGLTIGEVIVVIVVLALLVALLLPAFTQRKQLDGATRCLNNMRQIHGALTLYANANGGFFPVEPTEHNPHKTLVAALRPFLRSADLAVFYCPDGALMEPFAQDTASYAPVDPEGKDSVQDTPANREAGNIGYIYFSFLANKRAGAQYWRNLEFFPRILRRDGKEPPDPARLKFRRTQEDMARAALASTPAETWVLCDFYRQGAPFPHARAHGAGLNVLFLDGHAGVVTGSPRASYR